jgi:hypothetical protein
MTRLLEDEREVLRDGERLRVPIYAMDAEWRRTMDLIEDGMRTDHAERVAARDARALDAHRPGFRTAGDHFAQDRRERAYDEYVERITNAWKTPQRAEQDACESARDAVFGQDAAQASQAVRDAAYADYVRRLTNAWRNP